MFEIIFKREDPKGKQIFLTEEEVGDQLGSAQWDEMAIIYDIKYDYEIYESMAKI